MPDNHWPMINGVTMRGGVVYMSLRNTSGLIGVDYETKEIVFQKKWPDVAQQHCPYITDQGTILTFCNGNIRPPGIHHSRISEFDIKTGKQVWQYMDDMPPAFFPPYMGGVQRLWNGNTFICESAYGRLFEVTLLKEKLFGNTIPSLKNIQVL